ncbi:hypothetical protein IU726_004964, partial [Escherichia coli]|nr:hypothetical protein [Escherichia coli]
NAPGERIARPVLSLSAGENKLNNMSCIVGQLFFPETFKKFKFLLCFIMGNKVPISDVLLVSMWVILLLSSLKLLIDGRQVRKSRFIFFNWLLAAFNV